MSIFWLFVGVLALIAVLLLYMEFATRRERRRDDEFERLLNEEEAKEHFHPHGNVHVLHPEEEHDDL